MGRKKALGFVSVTTEDLHKVTYLLLAILTPLGGLSGSFRVEKFQGDSMLQWHDEIGELIYSSK